MGSQNIDFSMNYYALKTFGRQQYSNPWAALSELIANGFDAGAKNVYLFMDISKKEDSTIEIIDDGCGMDENDFREKYVIIGRNRRLDNPNDKAAGRKGIGKLAALYLSDMYQIMSVKDKQTTAWLVNVAGQSDSDTPCLQGINGNEIDINCSDIWCDISKKNGTIIRLLHVNLTRMGERAFLALKNRLSNYFLFNSLESSLYLCIVSEDSNEHKFDKIEKSIAFDNMVCIFYSNKEIINTTKPCFLVSFTDKNQKENEFPVERIEEPLPQQIQDEQGKSIPLSGKYVFDGQEKEYTLTGWIGVHASIDNKSAKKNDNRFIRNPLYNPNQIRIYVRNKLANENMLARLGLTGTYANYIEGEIAFDILDDNDLEDIATANRQDFSSVDSRVQLLQLILKRLCNQLIQRRQNLADRISLEKNKTDNSIQAKQKRDFAQETHNDLLSAGVESSKADELSFVIANKLKGNYDIKTSYKVFLSHSSVDHIFADFISNYLKHRGFRWDRDFTKSDIFYSSDGLDITNGSPLPEIIKSMIVDVNTDILFLTSNSFLDSQYCLFEGGAAWATRSIGDYCIIALDYKTIPNFLTNKKVEFSFENIDKKESFILNEKSYTNLIVILNRLIEHLNKNRSEPEQVALIPEPQFEDRVQMKKANKQLSDYMDRDVFQYWQTYVIDQLDQYFAEIEEKKNNKA